MSAETVADAERQAIEQYIREFNVEEAIQEMMQGLLEAKPPHPRQWLLNRLEQELADESEELPKSDMQRLFAVTRKITSEIVPQETINIVVSETLKLLNCDTVSLFVLDKKSGMLRLYASNLETPIVVSPGQGIAGCVFNTKETVNIPDCYQDSRFDKSFDSKSGYITRSLLAVPILDFDGSALGVIQAINKLPYMIGSTPADTRPSGMRAVPFSRNDEKLLVHLAQHAAIALRNAEVYREAISTSERSTGLLNTIQSLSQDLGTQSMILTITMHATKVVSSQRSTVFLVDEPNQQLWSVSTDTGQEIRIPKKAGIAGQCCAEGALINIPDAYADSRFNQEIDKKTGFKTQSILAVPMFEEDGNEKHGERGKQVVIGVIQMINKVSFDGQLEFFDDDDVKVMELFSKFVSPKLAHSSMLARRHSEHGLHREAELAFGMLENHCSRKGGASGDTGIDRKRLGSFAMVALGEEGEEEEDEAAK